MSMVLSRPAGLSRALSLLVLALATSSLAGCKRHPPAPTPAEGAAALALPSSLASAEEPGPEGDSAPAHCKQLPGFALTVDAAAPTKSANPLPPGDDAGDQEDDDTLLPFGVDIGAAVPTAAGFAVAGIRGAGMAFVALLDQHGGRRVDLGELHGDAETPALAAAGDDVIVALRSTDAAGFTLKLARLAATGSDAVQWGFELSKLGKTVTGVELAVTGGRGVLVYQGEEKQGASRLMLGTFSAASLKEPFEVKPVAVKDAELPRLSPREGGYWLSWVHALPEPKSPGKKPKGADAPADPEEADLLEVGLRVVEVAKLDERGQLLGAALRIGEPRRQVLLYDVAPLASGGLLVAARSDSAAPGAEGGALLLSEVGPDGSVHEERLEDDELGAGAPALFVDSAAKAAGPWLSMSSPSDATRLGLARGGHSVLQADRLLGRAEVIAVGAGHFLVQRARGRDVSLEALDCSWPKDGPAPNQ